MTTLDDAATRFDLPEDPEVASSSMLDDLRREITTEIAPEPITLMTKTRPGWAVRYNTDIEVSYLNALRKKAADRTQPDGINPLVMATALLASQCEALVKDGKDVVNEDGTTLDFRGLARMLDLDRPVDAVKHWYGKEGLMFSDMEEIMRAAGFGSDAELVDPTQRQ